MCNADFLGAGILKMALISMTPKRRGCLLLASYSQTDDNQPDPDLGEKWMVQIPGGVFYMNAKARLWASSPPRNHCSSCVPRPSEVLRPRPLFRAYTTWSVLVILISLTNIQRLTQKSVLEIKDLMQNSITCFATTFIALTVRASTILSCHRLRSWTN